MSSVLTAEGIQVMGQAQSLLQNIDMTLGSGELLGLIGPNGAGKSTLLQVLAQLRGYEGEVRYLGQNLKTLAVTKRAQILAYLQQTASQSWPIKVQEYVALGRIPHRLPRLKSNNNCQDQIAVARAMEHMDLHSLATRTMEQLSGGEFARVRLARALAVEAPILLADEPVAGLDPYHQLQVMELLKVLCGNGKSVVVVLHDLTLASRFCDRLLMLNKGKLVAAGEPRNILTPANLQQVYKVNAMVGEHQQQSYVVPWTCEI